ncbi:MAG: phytanoyl-CoA dioxygenase family protein [Vicinamibacterales bacterium]
MPLTTTAKTFYRNFLGDTTLAIKAKTALDYWLMAGRYREGLTRASPDVQRILQDVETHGYHVIPDFWDRQRCARAVADVDAMLEARQEFVHRLDDLRIFGAEDLSGTIREFADDRLLTELTERYFGGFQAFTLANRITCTPGNLGSGGGWHRDGFYRELKAILYLSDVGPENGAFQIVERSNNFTEVVRAVETLKLHWRQHRLSDREDALARQYPDRLKTLVGGAGSLLIFDTSCIHRGAPITQGVRYALTNYCWRGNYYPASQLRGVLDSYKLVNPERVYQKCLAAAGAVKG